MKSRCAKILAGFLAVVIIFTSSYFPLNAEEINKAILQITDDSAGNDIYCGDAVTLSAQVAEGRDTYYEYRFSLLQSESEAGTNGGTILKDFSLENSYVFHAEEAGEYIFEVAARDIDGQVITKTYTIHVLAKEELPDYESDSEKDQGSDQNLSGNDAAEGNSILTQEPEENKTGNLPSNVADIPSVSVKKKAILQGSLTSSSGNNAGIGEEVVLTADSSGGADGIVYRFTETYNGVVKTVQAYSKNNTYTFKAEGEGIHTFTLAIKDDEGNAANAKCIINVSIPSSKKLSGTLSSSTGTTADVREEVTLTAGHTGGYGEVEYRFTEVYNGETKTVQGYSENPEYTFSALGPGVHTYHLAIRDEEGQAVSTKYSINVQIPSSKKLSGTLSSSTGTTADVREEVTLTAGHTGGYGEVEYRFTEVYNGETKTVQGYSENPEYTFSALGPGVHTYHLAIRDEEGQAVSTKYSINVQVETSKKLTGVLVSDSGNTVKIKDSVTLRAIHTGGYGKVEYRFTEVYNGQAVTVQAYSEEEEYTFRATGPGVHTYHLAVRDEAGQAVSTTYSVNVTVPSEYKLEAQLTSAQGSKVYIRDQITLQAFHTGGYGTVKYRFTEVYNGVATTIRPYETGNTYTFKATGPGVHTYHLAVSDEEGQKVSTTFALTVQVEAKYKLSGKIESSKTNREYVDRTITLTGSHTGGYGKVEYRFTEVYNGQAVTVQPYGPQETYTFRTTKPGKHIYNLAIRDEEGQSISIQYVMEVVVHPDYRLSGTFTKNVTGQVKENQKITLTAQAKKGYGEPYLYRFTEEYNGKATTVQPYSEKNTYEFVIKGQGTHKYTVAIMDCEGQAISLTQTITIGKNGWYYEGGYKFYYINNVKQLDLDGILPKQSSYEIWVNRQCCTVTVYAKDGNNGYIIPVKRFACSVGLPSTPTPKGTFYTSNKYRWHTLMGPSYGQYCTRIVGGILFHSVAGRNMTSYNLKASDYNKLGSPASHGCVRLCVRDAKWIYDNCKSGTKVVIYDSSSPGPLGKPTTIKIPAGQTWDPTDPNL